MSTVSFFVPGFAAPQGSKNAYPIRNKVGVIVGVNQVESSKSLRPWRGDVKTFAQDAVITAEMPLLTGAVFMHCHFVMKRPVATPKTKPTPPAVKKPDLDKLVRAIGDALKGTVYAEDSLVTHIVASKRIAELDEQPGVFITVGDAHAAP